MQNRTGKTRHTNPGSEGGHRSGLAWNDFELVLAIADAGSLSGASRRLRVSHATVFRRLGEIEQRLGVILFERYRSGYQPTLAGEELAATARVMEEAALAAERKVTRHLLTDMPEKQIAGVLDQSHATTHKHINSIYRKFNVNSRSALMPIWLGERG